MKQLILKSTLSLSLVFFVGCGGATVAPSHNKALNNISDSDGKERAGFMQNTLDNFITNEWTPTVSKDKEIQKKYLQKVEDPKSHEVKYVEKKDKNFTLQETVDKGVAYLRAHPSDYEHSHLHKLESMPVIGK